MSDYKLLVVARWPLGGIRTYMRYVYRHLPAHFRITLVAASTQEDEALQRDAGEIGARVIFCTGSSLTGTVFRELRRGGYRAIQSHGFISALHVAAANLLCQVPHILTVHGVLEDRLVAGIRGRLRMLLTAMVIRHVDVLYAVSHDILEHLHQQVRGLAARKNRQIVIPNGIDVTHFIPAMPAVGGVREEMGCDEHTVLFGFLGRFMPQKGFNFLIDAVAVLVADGMTNLRILAVGSGDYRDYYRQLIGQRHLEEYFHFMPFHADVSAIYRELDAIVMPSLWEACPLQPMEALCMGVPVIASDCIGLREVIRDTPALAFTGKNSAALAERLRQFVKAPDKAVFRQYAATARERFAVQHTAAAFAGLLESLPCGGKGATKG